ncbi:g4926 [Coccomyxa elongata]
MHPPLHVSKHPHCKKEIEALISCHTEHALAKFIGKCNQQKWDLDACFKREKAIKRALNFAKAKEEQARFHRALKIDQQLQQQEEEGRQGE